MSVLRILFGCWALAAAAFIEFYARRYDYAGTPIFPLGLVGLLALALLLLPPRALALVPMRPPTRRLAIAAMVVASALAFALLRPLQVVHVSIVAGLLAIALAMLAPLLRPPGPSWLARLAAAAVLAALTFGLLAYYAVLVVGLEMWNEIVSRTLIWTYALQLPALVATLPFSAWLTWCLAAAFYGVLLLAYWLALPGIARDICEALAPINARLRTAPRKRRWAELAIGLLATAFLAHAVISLAGIGTNPDPLAATLVGGMRPRGAPRMPFEINPALDAAEMRAAALYAPPASVERRPLVLITVDGLRADQTHVYGHPRENTPFLSRLHREGRLARFDNVFSACTESHCGLLAILGARDWHELSAARRRFGLADVLKRLGYRTHFLLGGDHTNFYSLRSYYGDNIDEYVDGASARRYMNDDALVIDWLRRLDARGDAPRFIYVHLMSTHMLGKRAPQFDLWHGKPPGGAGGGRCCSPSQTYFNNYHQGVRQADALIEEMFSILEAKGLLNDALVAITADHGEMLGEFGIPLGHGGPPRDPAVRVPLLIFDARGFAYPPRRLASVIDIAPTFLERIGAPIPAPWTGVPLSRPDARPFVLMQTRDEVAVVGDFGGELYKYYYRARPGALAEELVRLDRPAVETTVPDGQRPEIRSMLRAELARQLPALRR